MRRFTRNTFIAAAVGVLIVGTVALAGGAKMRHRQQAILQADTNKDGQLDEAERQAMHERMRAAHQEHRREKLEKFDANRNGELDPDERQKLRQERSAERFRKLDADGNGSLSLEEFQSGAGGYAFGRHGPR